jgi:hypothetical protein
VIAELAVVLPILLLGLVGLADFGRATMETITVANAAHAGAKYGSHSTYHMTDIVGIRSAALAEMQEMSDLERVSIDAARYCSCPDGELVSCADGVCGETAESRRTYVRVRVEKLFETVFTYPGVPDVIILSREAHVRAR